MRLSTSSGKTEYMAKGSRIRSERLNVEIARLRAQNEQLIQMLAAERVNSRNAGLLMGCLVKRTGSHVPTGIRMEWQIEGWQVQVTDEEIAAIGGELRVSHNESAASTVLTVVRPKGEVEADRERHRVDTGQA